MQFALHEPATHVCRLDVQANVGVRKGEAMRSVARIPSPAIEAYRLIVFIQRRMLRFEYLSRLNLGDIDMNPRSMSG